MLVICLPIKSAPGIYQVDVMSRAGGGAGAVNAVVDDLLAHFLRGTRLATAVGFDVTISRAYAGPALVDAAR